MKFFSFAFWIEVAEAKGSDDCLQRFTSNSRQFDHNPRRNKRLIRIFFFSHFFSLYLHFVINSKSEKGYVRGATRKTHSKVLEYFLNAVMWSVLSSCDPVLCISSFLRLYL